MSKIINSSSKFRPTEEMLKEMTKKALSHNFTAFNYRELSGGLCSTVYLIETEQNKVVLKLSAPKGTVVMRHEREYVPVEAKMLKIFEEKLNIPAPKLIFFDDTETICPVSYFFMTFIKGTPLTEMWANLSKNEISEIKFNLGEICGKISSLKADKFGIPDMPETYTSSNYEFIITLFQMLFKDISDKNIFVPEAAEKEMLNMLKKCEAALSECKQPVYTHTDTWDGNLMIYNNRLEGLIDYAAVLYGDPLISHDFHDFAPMPDPDFCRGFKKESFTENEKVRILVYRIWHRLGMIAERGFRNYDDPNTYAWVLDEYVKDVRKLKSLTNSL